MSPPVASFWPIGTPANATIAQERLVIMDTLIFWVIASWIGFVFSAVALGTSYAYKKQRKFPVCMVSWSCALDILIFMIAMIKWSNYGPLSESMVWNPSQTACAVSFLWSEWVSMATVVINISQTFLIFMCLVKKVDISYDADKRYFWIITGLAPLCSTIYIAAMGSFIPRNGGYLPNPASCNPASSTPATVDTLFVIGSVIIESVFIGITVKYVRGALRGVQHIMPGDHDKKILRLSVRFTAIIFLQTLPHICAGIFYWTLSEAEQVKTPKALQTSKTASQALAVIEILCYWVNAAFVMASNKQLRKTISRRCYKVLKRSSSNFPPNLLSPKNTSNSFDSVSSVQIELNKT